MRKKVKAAPNQSLLDMVVTEYGTLEAAIAVCTANDISISYLPSTGEEITMPDVSKQDDIVLYLQRNNIVIGTVASHTLDYVIVLKPAMRKVPNVIGDPHAIGYYSFDYMGLPEFVHVYPLTDAYLSENRLYYSAEERHLTGLAAESAPPSGVVSMAGLSIPYVLPWTVGFGYMLVWSDLSAPVVTCSFKDIEGNTAYAAPLTLFDNTTNTVIEGFIGDVVVEKIGATIEHVILKLTRIHAEIATVNMRDYSMVWVGAAAGATPDPEDPLNDDVRIVTLTSGVHTIGIKTTYYFPGTTPPYPYPTSGRTMVIKVH